MTYQRRMPRHRCASCLAAGAVTGVTLLSALATHGNPSTSGPIERDVDRKVFAGAVVERFQGKTIDADTYDFGNGMVHTNLDGQSDLINRTSSYGMGNGPRVLSGAEGEGDGYFGTGVSPTTFELAFARGVTQFGFLGAEAHVFDGSNGRNAEMNIEFYDGEGVLIAALAEPTPFDTHAWDQWHGFRADAGVISRIVFRGVGHMVLDDVSWLVRCPADFDGDGMVGVSDLIEILCAWGNKGGPEDLDGSGFVDIGDLLVLLETWGPCA